MTAPILASATVDMLRFGPVPLWSVTVTGHDRTRVYDVDATTDDRAAQKGIEMFVEEIQNLRDAANENP